MESIKLWLDMDENRKQVPEDQLNIVLHEMIVKDIGIRGGNIFTITYPIVATVRCLICFNHTSYRIFRNRTLRDFVK